jgi:hypothetical protein
VIPPYSNRGVYPPNGASPFDLAEGFDAYSFSAFVTSADALYDDLFCLLESAGLEPQRAEGPKIKFYARNRLLLDETGHRLLQVRSGGTGGNALPYVDCKGRASPVLAEYAREHLRHRPSRIDHAVDRHADGLFERLAEWSKALAKEFRVAWSPAGDWVTPDAGRTFYLGSRKSQIMVRVYEKGLKYAHDMGLPVTQELRDWVRIEVEFKPDKPQAKDEAAVISPAQLWGSTRWTKRLAEEILGMETAPVSIRERRESNRDRALRFMGIQYGAHLASLLDECQGDYAKFGGMIADLARIDEDGKAAA